MRLAPCGLALLFAATVANAHPHFGDGPSLTPDLVDEVIDALDIYLAGARAAGGLGLEPDSDTALGLLIEIAPMTRNAAPLPPQTEAVLLTYEAHSAGAVSDSGEWVEDFDDLFTWYGRINPADAAVVVPYASRLDAWQAEFSEALR